MLFAKWNEGDARLKRTLLCLLLAVGFVLFPFARAAAAPLEDVVPVALTAPCALLCDAESGAVIFEKNADERRPVASVTKLMTLLLVFERLQSGELSLAEEISISPTAARTGGSTALLDAGAKYPLEELLRATIVASGNDSAVALAERVAGTEGAFVALMNARAAELALDNTQYKNCTGLPVDGQYTTARDVAALSCALAKHPEYHEYAKTWLYSLQHPGGRTTDLTNTNRLIRFYTDCDGFKTGSTNEAKYCVSATAERKGMRLVAVVLGVQASQTRFDEARAMLDYGFATYSRAQIAVKGEPTGESVRVELGGRDSVEVGYGAGLSMLLKSGQAGAVSVELTLPGSVRAPVKAGDTLGSAAVMLSGAVVARLPVVALSDVRLPGVLEGFVRVLENWK